MRGALGNEGSAYQFAARASALILRLVSAMLLPSASYSNRVLIIEAINRALEACDMKMACGYAEETW